jgi:hypothetical protein
LPAEGHLRPSASSAWSCSGRHALPVLDRARVGVLDRQVRTESVAKNMDAAVGEEAGKPLRLTHLHFDDLLRHMIPFSMREQSFAAQMPNGDS